MIIIHVVCYFVFLFLRQGLFSCTLHLSVGTSSLNSECSRHFLYKYRWRYRGISASLMEGAAHSMQDGEARQRSLVGLNATPKKPSVVVAVSRPPPVGCHGKAWGVRPGPGRELHTCDDIRPQSWKTWGYRSVPAEISVLLAGTNPAVTDTAECSGVHGVR
ncbi:hypothetical protein Micbo1qcDRAFT_162584 [Microdochium bolleyi]|uniref:Secreted protein n=1 Tax=Microdochium bolleyi TaxID=196109 RepID=A0A136J561_9PEZI|nr:hypothetical protein Micbo1qcDRAFT_162584 [Microdochium bolleyi]